MSAGAKVAYLIDEPLAASIGARMPIAQAAGHMIVNIGGGSTESAVISLGGVVVHSSVRVVGNKLDEGVANYVKKKFNLVIGVKEVLEQCPPELASDIIDKGIVMSGGTSLLANFDKLMTEMTGVPCHVAEDALLCVARGTGVAMENIELYKRSINKR